jgi:hypothetical protein
VPRFVDDDAGYLEWAAANTAGYVLNCERQPNPNYLILHRADCKHITVPGPQATRWTAYYIKICALSKADLEVWSRVETGASPTACRTRSP